MRVFRVPRPKITNDSTRLADEKAKLKRAYKARLAKLLRDNPTPSERMMIDLLDAHKILYQFQPVMLGYIPDFYFKRSKTIVEVDGDIHKDRKEYDRHRDEVFRENGFHVLRIDAKDLKAKPDVVLSRVTAYLGKRRKRIKRVAEKKVKAKAKRWQSVPKLTKDHLQR